MHSTASHESAPLYRTLADRLEGMIGSNSLRPGDRMPSVRQFARQQRVSVPTAMHAYATLETRGLVEARPKSGFFVRASKADLVRAPKTVPSAPKGTDFSSLDPLDSIIAAHDNPELVPLGMALPDPELLPGEKLARSMSSIARSLGARSTNYDMPPGNESLRRELARRSLDWGCSLQPEEFIITNGCTEALSLALRAVCNPGDTVVVESPTYFGLTGILRELQLKALPIPVDNVNGIDLDALETCLRRNKVAACALIPNFHNPVGYAMPEERKRRLLEIVSKRDIPVIEDDIYGELNHSGDRPRCLKAFDRNGLVILCSSFSKNLAPGYRVGYVAAGRWHAKVLRLKIAYSLANATLPSLVISEYLRNGGYDRYLRTLRQTYRQQVERMREAVVHSFPEGIGLSRPQGNFVLWCELPPQIDSLVLFKQALRAGISIAPGPLFSPDGGFRNFLRLNCGYPMTPAVERAVTVLGQLARQLARS